MRMPRRGRPLALIILIAVQLLCAAVFVSDSISDFIADGDVIVGWHMVIEYTATLSLLVAIVVESQLLMQLLRREAHLERGMSIAAGALNDLIEEYFRTWGLTPSEQDVARFLIKGCEIAEIARLRGSAEGTVKAHLNAIYRKSGVSGRAALVSMLIEDLMEQPLVGADEGL
jgi:DNA-binding CsgD family transcriptional regulator